MFKFSKELANLLQKIRRQANLSQAELAQRMGLRLKSGRSFIAQLESGKIKNPTLNTIISYINACGGNRMAFFSELDRILSKQEQAKVLSEIPDKDSISSKRVNGKTILEKIEQDASLFANKIKYQKKPDEMIDKAMVRDKIERKVLMLLSNHRTDKSLIPIYLDYTYYILERALNPDPNPSLDEKPWLKSGIKKVLFGAISHIVYNTIKTEKKKLARRKIPSSEKQQKMVQGFIKYRAAIEQIEFRVHTLLNELQVAPALYLAYKDYTRACYKALKQCYHKDESLLQQQFKQIKVAWKLNGLADTIMEKVKDTVIVVYKELLFKGTAK